MIYRAQKATCPYEMKMMHKVKIQTIIIVFQKHINKMSVKWPDRLLGLIITRTLTSRATPCIGLDLHHVLILTMICLIRSVTMEEKLVRFQQFSIIASTYGHN